MTLAATAPRTTIADLSQQVRDLIEEARHGHADSTDIHQALDNLEAAAGLPPTTAA